MKTLTNSTKRKIFIALGLTVLVVLLVTILILATNQVDSTGDGVVAGKDLKLNGYYAHELELEDINGNQINFSDYKGKFVIVDFWASWCTTCKIEATDLVELSQKWAAQVEFIGIAIWDSDEQIAEYIAEYQVPYTIAHDKSASAAINFGLVAVPEKYILSPEGKIILKLTGARSKSSFDEIITNFVEEYG